MMCACRRSCRRKTRLLAARSRRQAGAAGERAAPFHQDDIVPDVVDVAVTLTIADLAKSDPGVQGAAGFVQGQDLGLQRPVAFGLRRGDQRVEQGFADALAVCC